MLTVAARRGRRRRGRRRRRLGRGRSGRYGASPDARMKPSGAARRVEDEGANVVVVFFLERRGGADRGLPPVSFCPARLGGREELGKGPAGPHGRGEEEGGGLGLGGGSPRRGTKENGGGYRGAPASFSGSLGARFRVG